MKERKIYEIANEIYGSWKKVNPCAMQYLEAMFNLEKISDHYGFDTGAIVVSYFLANSKSWKGDDAKRIKAELKKMIKG